MLSRISVLFVLFSIGLPTSAKEVRVKFQDLKRMVETQNERVRAAEKEARASQSREGHLRRSFLPRVEVYAAQETFKTGTQDVKTQPDYGAEASINLYNGGRDRLREQGLGFRSKRKEFEQRTSLAEELGKARELFWRIVFHKNAVAIMKEALVLNAADLKAANRRIASGVATQSDRLEFEMKAVELKRESNEAELAVRANSRDLLVMLGISPSVALITDTELSHTGEWESEIKHTHLDHEFLVKPAEFLSEEAQTAAKEAARQWLPKVDAYAGWNQYNQREEEDRARARERQEAVIGIRLQMDVFDGLSSRTEAQALTQEAEAARLLADYKRKQNEAHVEKEFDELHFLHERVHEADENIKSAERYHRLTQSEYSRGVKNSPDVLGATEKLLAMKLKRLEMIRDFQIARSHVLSKIGK